MEGFRRRMPNKKGEIMKSEVSGYNFEAQEEN